MLKTKHLLIFFLAFVPHGYCELRYCSGFDKAEKNSIYGDALTDPADCVDRHGRAYPAQELKKMLPQFKKMYTLGGNVRQSRGMQFDSAAKVQNPDLTREQLMNFQMLASQGRIDDITKSIQRTKRQGGLTNEVTTKDWFSFLAEQQAGNATATTETPPKKDPEDRPQTCVPDNEITPARLCKSTFNTTAPMYGVSLTSGEPVTIVQIFPDLLQQVVFEMCDAKECDVLHGECVQTYVPYLFLVIPLGPVTLTGQDYVLVESGCTCRPKFSRPGSEPNPASIIPSF